MEKSGVIGGFPYFAEPYQPFGWTLHLTNVMSLADLREQFLPFARAELTKRFAEDMANPSLPHAGVAFSYPARVGVHVFDVGTPGLTEGAPGYRKPGAKLGNYGAENPFTKDCDPAKVVEELFNKVNDGLADTTTNADAKGLGIQFAYFAPLHVNIGLELAFRLKEDNELPIA